MSDQQNLSTAPAKGAGPETPARPRLRSDHKVALGVVAFSSVVLWLTVFFDEVPAALTQGVPPESYPKLLAWTLIVFAAILAFQALGWTDKKKKPVKPIVFQTTLLLVVATVSINWLGIFGAMIIGCVAIPILWGERRYWMIGLYAVAFPAAVYGLFHGILEVQFPLGIFKNMF